LSNSQIADIIKAQPEAMVVADSAEPKSIDEIKLHRLNIHPAAKGPGSVSQGIQYVQSQNISVTKKSTNIIKEYRNYMWMTDKLGKPTQNPDHGFSHSMDAIRYAFSLRKKEPKITFLGGDDD
jgi:phage terminase large subunit